MDVIKMQPHKPTHKGLVIGQKISPVYILNINYGGNIKEINNQLHFIITINIDVEILMSDKSLMLATAHSFEVILKTRDISLKTEDDFWLMAELIQVATAHTRIFLMQEADKYQLKIGLIPIESMETIYDKIKDGYYSLWN